MPGGYEGAPLSSPTAPPCSTGMSGRELSVYRHGSSRGTRGGDRGGFSGYSFMERDAQPSSSLLPNVPRSRWMGLSPSPFDTAHDAAASSSSSSGPRTALVQSRWMGVSPSPFDSAQHDDASAPLRTKAHHAGPCPVSTATGPRTMESSFSSRGTELHLKQQKISPTGPDVSGKVPPSELRTMSRSSKPNGSFRDEDPVLMAIKHEPDEKEEEQEFPPQVLETEQKGGLVDEAPVKQQPEEEEEEQPQPQLPPPVPEQASNPWGQKKLRLSRDRAFSHLPPGVPRKVRYESHLKDAATEVQRRLGTQLDISHLSGRNQLMAVLPGDYHPRSLHKLLDTFSDFCDAHPVPHPPPPPPPPPPSV